jgi:hypothetical protein
MNSNSIIDSIDIEKYNTIEKEREKIMGDEKFIQWCKDMNIGVRVEVKDYRAIDMNTQYSHNYPKWVQQKF